LINLYPPGISPFRLIAIAVCLWATAAKSQSSLCFPELVQHPDVVLDCADNVPDFGSCAATSACCGEVTLDHFTSETGQIDQTCVLSTAFGPGPDWAFWLPDIDPLNVSWLFENNGLFEEFADGTARLTGIIYNAANPSLRMEATLWMHNKRNWAQWSALGRSYKDDYNLAGNNYQNWAYYELVEGFAWLNGIGQLAGSQLILSHKPATYYFGFQSGIAANSKNTNDGLSGWFTYTGYFAGEQVIGHGDVNVDRSCSVVDPGCGSTAFTRICRATNECQLSAYSSQTISLIDTTPPVITQIVTEVEQNCFSGDVFYPTATDNCSQIFITYQDEIITPGCSGSFIRTYTVSDGCGNSVTAQQLVNLTGGTPEFTAFPIDETVPCGLVPPINSAEITYTSGCSNTVLTSQEVLTPGNCPGNYVLQRIYTLTDDCGNSVSATWTITVIDNLPPVLSGIPADAVYSCGEVFPVAPVTAFDLCTPELDIILSGATQQLECGYLFIRTWTVTDACGNSASASQTITVTDAVPPVFTFVPADLEYACGSSGEIASAVAVDACSPVALTFVDEALETGCPGSFHRIYTATDGCGNTASAAHDVILTDDEPPVFLAFPEDLTVPCGQVPSVESADVVFTDNCSGVEVNYDEYIFDEECPVAFILERVWTLIDACGNSTQRTWVITVVDNEAPQLFGVPADQVLTCGVEPAQALVTAVDACDPEPLIGLSATTVPLDCGFQFVRTWTALDACGNSTSASQIILYTDDLPPVFTYVPSDVEITCGDDFPEPDATADDLCSEVVVTYTDIPQEDCLGGVIRVFTATDGCGNTATASQSIMFSDNEPPVLIGVPGVITASCDDLPDTEDLGVTAVDNCSNVILSRQDQLVPGVCDGEYTLIITWTALDACGNSATAVTEIQVSDTEGPQIPGVIPALTLNCGDDIPTTDVNAVDNCSGVAEVNFDEEVITLDCGYQLVRTWTAVDHCGNLTLAQQVITIEDTEDPVFLSFPENVQVSCGSIPTLQDGAVTYSDDCSGLQVGVQETVTEGACPVVQIIERTWTLTDGCGNTEQRTWTITVVDNEAPQLIGVPANQVLNCGVEPAQALVDAIDNCDSDPLVGLSATTVPLECGYEFIRTWIAIDACGNTSNATQVITYIDNSPPVFVFVPDDIAVECGGEFPTENAIAQDDCGTVTVTVQDIPQEDCLGGLLRVFTATDGCGNTATATQSILFSDTEAPVFTAVPGSIVTSCDDVPDFEELQASAVDNCSDVTITRQDLLLPGSCPNAYTLLITWTAQDACGNSTTATTEIQVSDNEAPVISGDFTPLTLNCGDEIPLPLVSATDNCTPGIQVSFAEQIQTLECGSQIVRTWSAVDQCGNQSQAQQTIVVEDTEVPVFLTFPEDVEVSCGAIPSLEQAGVTYSDDCSDLNVVFQQTVNDGSCPILQVIERVWTITDGCGNSVQRTWIITVVDNEAPLLVGIPADQTLSCGQEPAQALVDAIDNCDSDPLVGLSATTVPLECGYEFIRTWIALDACGNTSSASQVITYIDNSPPVFVFVPQDIAIECGGDFPSENAIAQDDCGTVTVTSQDIPQEDCLGGILRVFTATDACGNTATASQSILFSDTESPQFISVPGVINAMCDAVPDLDELVATAVDNCSNVTITREEEIFENSCPGEYTIVITWTAEDACGNATNAYSEIHVMDLQGPAFSGDFSSLTLECGTEAPLPDMDVTDACSGVDTVVYEETEVDLECGYELTRTWTATDLCGNVSVAQQTILFEDTTNPYFLQFPESVTISCGDPMPPLEIPQAYDACLGEVPTYYTEDEIPTSCGGSVVYRVFRAFDDCGNQAIYFQAVTIVNDEAPDLSEYPSDIQLECGEPLPSAPDISAFDFCQQTDVPVTFSETVLESGLCGTSVQRTWCASNCAGETCWTQTISYPGAQGFALFTPAWQMRGNLMMNLRMLNTGRAEVRVYTNNGQLADIPFSQEIRSSELTQVPIDTQRWTPGIYHLVAIQGKTMLRYSIAIPE